MIVRHGHDRLGLSADKDSPLHDRCRALLDAWRRQVTPWCLTWGIFYEFLRVSTHPRMFRSFARDTDFHRFPFLNPIDPVA